MLGIPEEQEQSVKEPEKTVVSKVGRTIHPSDPALGTNEIVEEGGPRPSVDVASIYPEAAKDIDPTPSLGANASYALQMNEDVYRENSRPVSTRAKSLLVLGILSALSGLFYLVSALALSSNTPYKSVVVGVSLIQLGIDAYLLLSQSVSGVTLLLKIFLVLQLFSLISSIVNPIALVANGLMAMFLFYVYGTVKSLR